MTILFDSIPESILALLQAMTTRLVPTAASLRVLVPLLLTPLRILSGLFCMRRFYLLPALDTSYRNPASGCAVTNPFQQKGGRHGNVSYSFTL